MLLSLLFTSNADPDNPDEKLPGLFFRDDRLKVFDEKEIVICSGNQVYTGQDFTKERGKNLLTISTSEFYQDEEITLTAELKS